MKKKFLLMLQISFTAIVLSSCSNPENELPRSVLTGNDWFVDEGNPNNLYSATIRLQFHDGKVDAWEGTSAKSCTCNGDYTINEARNQFIINGLGNNNCPWMSELNGTYSYKYNASNLGYTKYMFVKGKLVIRHLLDESR